MALRLGFESPPERLERNPLILAIFSLIQLTPTTCLMVWPPKRFAITRALHDLIRHLVLLIGKITGENRSRSQWEQTSVREMDANTRCSVCRFDPGGPALGFAEGEQPAARLAA